MKKALLILVFASLGLLAFSQNESAKIKLFQPTEQKKAVINESNQPLMILDGKILEGQNDSNLNRIDPNDIASVDVIKDKNAVAAYGEKGKNGVVIITSKKYKAFQEKQKNLPAAKAGTEGVKD
jgi:TonB-dependent SusC/RagA subfamily outer membrane receptor